MEFWSMALLALVQGLTEFLPISSSAHLILAPRIFGFADQGLAFDVAVHFGSLLAVMIYFRRRIADLTVGFLSQWGGESVRSTDARLANAVIVATIPVVIAGLLLKGLVETDLRSPLVIAAATIGFGLLLLVADLRGSQTRTLESLTMRDAVIIGLFQALALIPGTSRSGITITAALLGGFRRRDASEFSFLIAIPTILMSASLVTLELVLQDGTVDWGSLAIGGFLSFVAAYLCIHFFLMFIERMGMMPFVVYRLLLGIVLLVIFT